MKILPLTALVILATTTFSATADNKEPTTCSLATLKGTYTWTVQTSLSSSAGRDSFDGKGGVVTQSSSNSSPVITTTSSNYTVNEDCTGTQTGGDGTYNYFISPDGDSFSWVDTDGTSISSGIETRVSKALLVK